MSNHPTDNAGRALHFIRKLIPGQVESTLSSSMPAMHRSISKALGDQARIHALVRTVCRPAGIPAHQLLAYSAYALQIHRLKLLLGGDAKLPIAAALTLWSRRGLVPELLDQIRDVVTGIHAAPAGDNWRFIALGAAQHPLAYNPTTGILAVLCTGDDKVQLVDTLSLAIIDVATATGPKSLAWNVTTNQLYVVCDTPGVLCAIDGTTHARTDVALPDTGGQIAIDELHDRAWISTEGSAFVWRVTLGGLTVVPIPVDNPTYAIAVDQAGGYAWAGAAYDYELYKVDIALGTFTTIALSTIPQDLALDTVHAQGVITSAIDALCTVIDLVSNATDDVALPGYPLALAIDAVRRCAFIPANWPDNTVSRVHLDSLVSEPVLLSHFAPAISCDPGSGHCILGNANPSSCSILNSDTLALRVVDTSKGAPTYLAADQVAHRWFIATTTPNWLCILTPAP